MADWGCPPYRARQVYHGIYQRLSESFGGLTDLPQALRDRLADSLLLPCLEPIEEAASSDGQTRKALFRLADGQAIESVLMEHEGESRDWNTVCLSSQVGCVYACPFCATGQAGFVRDLRAGEMVEQYLFFARKGRVQHVVFMGMGEPLANYQEALKAIGILMEPAGLKLGARRITISTVGLAPQIRRLAQEQLQVGLAVSLHAPTDELRDTLVPVNRKHPLKELMAACRYYFETTRRRVTFEYALFAGINDSPREARALAQLLGEMPCHVNLIPGNPSADPRFRPSPRVRVAAFLQELRGLAVTVRVSRGLDIQAGCGQLRGQWQARRG